MNNQINYIISLEAKDIVNSKNNNYILKSNKKYKAAFDNSKELIKLNDIAKKKYKELPENQKDDSLNKLIYQYKNKKYKRNQSDAIINVTFKYSAKEFNKKVFDKEIIYIERTQVLTKDIYKKLVFKNGICIDSNNLIIAIKPNIKIEECSHELPCGFIYEKNDNSIYISVDDTKIKTKFNTSELRHNLYKDGFSITYECGKIIKYVRYKRSTGSSRVGKCLFIREDLYEEIMKWSYMDINYEENDLCDLAALEAYISLTMSSIIDTINIKPKNILVIDDYTSIFNNDVIAVEVEKIDDKDRLVSNKKNVQINNKIWDGQSIMDISLFGEKYKDKGVLLLRNRMFKSACFNGNIQKFFKDNNINNIKQLNGFTLAKDIKDILLITTPSSIKYTKFNKLKNYLEQIDEEYGIVKFDKPTHYFNGDMVQTHYQLLNTLQMSKNDVKFLLKDTLDYIKLLKNDIKVFRNHLKIKINDSINIEDYSSTDKFIFEMLNINNNLENTDLFVNFRRDLIKSYIKNVRSGHILIHGNYSVLFGNPIEMLYASIKDNNGNPIFGSEDKPITLNNNDVYCKKFKNNIDLIASRSPHITISNVLIAYNRYNELFDKYLNLTNEIVCINSIKNNIMERLSSCDFDIDSVLLSDSELLIKCAKKNFNNFLVATSCVKSQKVERYNNAYDKAELDIKTSVNLIGDIVNLSMILNSKLWNQINNGSSFDDIQELYKDICKLSIMSCIEIDKAKKEFTINNSIELKEIVEKWLDFVWIEKSTGKKTTIDCEEILRNIIDLRKQRDKEMKELKKIEYKNLKQLENSAEDNKDNAIIFEEINNNINNIKSQPITSNNLTLIKNELFKKALELSNYKKMAVRPRFFEIVGEGKEYWFENFKCTMDYLEQIISDDMKYIRMPKRNRKNKPIVALIDLLDIKDISLSEADRKQHDNIIHMIKDLKTEQNKVWTNYDLSYEDKSKSFNELKINCIKIIKDYKIKESTMKKLLLSLLESDNSNIVILCMNILFTSKPVLFKSMFKNASIDFEVIQRIENNMDTSNIELIKLYNIDYGIYKKSELLN